MTVLAEFLAGHGDAVVRLLIAHHDDGTGHCAVCSAGAQTGRYDWPCTVATAASAARTAASLPC